MFEDLSSNECPGNPIDAGTRNKIESSVDYINAQGTLKVTRQYLGQQVGWSVATPQHLTGNIETLRDTFPVPEANPNSGPGGSAGFATQCPYAHPITYSSISNGQVVTYEKWQCPKFAGYGSSPLNTNSPYIALWSGKKSERFIPVITPSANNGRYTVSVGSEFYSEKTGGKTRRIRFLDPAQNQGASWRLTSSGGDQYEFSAAGELIRTVFARGGYVTYDYTLAPWYLAAQTDHFGRQLRYEYDEHHRLIKVILPTGGEILYTYVSANPASKAFSLLASVTWPGGKQESYVYNESVFTSNTDLPLALTGKFDTDGTRIGTYTYYQRKAKTTEGANGVGKFTVTAPGANMAYVDDAFGNRETYNFSKQASGELVTTSRRQPAGSGCAATSDASTYDSNGLLVKYRNLNGHYTQYAYDTNSHLEITRVEGVKSTDTKNYLPASTVLADGVRKISTQWLKPGFMQQRAEPQKVTRYVYEGQLHPITGTTASCIDGTPQFAFTALCAEIQYASTDTNGAQAFSATLNTAMAPRIKRYRYNTLGQIVLTGESTSVVGTNVSYNDSVLSYYDADGVSWQRGDLRAITNALGHITTFTAYDENGKATSIIDANGTEHQLTFDDQGHLLAETQGGLTSQYSYNEEQLLAQIRKPDGSTIDYSYDNAKRLIQVANASGERINYEYDLKSNLRFVRYFDAQGLEQYAQEHTYDALARKEKTLGSDGLKRQYYYDALGNVTAILNGRNGNYGQQFDALGRLITATDALQQQTRFSYDNHDQIATVTDARNLTTQYTYNAFGELTQLSSPDTGITQFVYDAAGNLSSKTDARGIVTHYQYDALKRLTQISYPASPAENVSYHYDDTSGGNHGIGRLTGIDDPSGSTRYHYDALGRLERKTLSLGANSWVTSYTYNALGQLSQMSYPSGRIVHYGYNSLGQLDSLSTQAQAGSAVVPVLSQVGYLPFGPLNQALYGNGVNWQQDFDRDYRLSQLSISGTSPLLQRAYSYDANDNIVAVDFLDENTVDQNFSYDLLDRLTGAGGLFGNIGYSYDAVGNRTARNRTQAATTLQESYAYASTSNRLNSVNRSGSSGAGTRSLQYDAAGNVVADSDSSTASITYNHANRPSSWQRGGTQVQFVHNALGQRTQKTQGAQTQHFIYDEAGQLIFIDGAAANDDQEWIYFGNTIVAAVIHGELHYVHNDHLATPQKITDAQQNVVWAVVEQSPFGEVMVNGDVDGDGVAVVFNARFPGQYWDGEIGTSYNYFRTYDPSLGRYVQSDPIGLRGGVNTYGYVEGNPLKFVDPKGLWGNVVAGATIRVIGGRTAGAAVTRALQGVVGYEAGQILGCALVGNCSFTPPSDSMAREVGDTGREQEQAANDDEHCPPIENDQDPCEEIAAELRQLRDDINRDYITGRTTELEYQALRELFNGQLRFLRQNCPGYGQNIPNL